MAELGVGVLCGQCGGSDIHMEPCKECDHVQASVCFGCGSVYRVVDHHDPDCLERVADA